jgi:hypothetical protein
MMGPTREVREVVEQALDESAAGLALLEMAEAADGSKYVLRVGTPGEREHLLRLYKRGLIRALDGPGSAARVRDLIGTELLAQHTRRPAANGHGVVPGDAAHARCSACARAIVPGDRAILWGGRPLHVGCPPSPRTWDATPVAANGR